MAIVDIELNVVVWVLWNEHTFNVFRIHTRSKDETKLSRSMLCISDFSGQNYWNCVSRQNIKLGMNIAICELTKWKKGANSFGSNHSGLYCSHGFEMNIMLKLYFVYIYFFTTFSRWFIKCKCIVRMVHSTNELICMFIAMMMMPGSYTNSFSLTHTHTISGIGC